MKKLMFATALVASVAAFADPPTAFNATSFEGYTGAVVGTGGGDAGEQDANGNYFYYYGDTDGSVVKTFGGENLTAPSTRTAYYTAINQANQKYLELSTEGGILWRSINQISYDNGVYDLGASTNVAADGIYLDTLVQFTPTEDGGAPELESGVDKLAIWLNVDSNGVTNLMVRAMAWTYEDEDLLPTPTSFVVNNVSVDANTWYRLTVKAIPSVTTGNYIFPAFQIFIDGTEVSATEAQYSSDIQTLLASRWAEGMQSLAAANKLFPSLAGRPSNISAVTLQGVGFKGSGALDDLVWTTEDPFAGGGTPAWIDAVTNVFTGTNLTPAQKSDIASWATANSITVNAGQEEIAAAAYLLGQTTLPTAAPELTITSIVEGESAWTLTVAATANDTALTLPSTIPGVITLTQAATLAGLDSANAATASFTIANGTATVTVAKDAAAAKFMKVGVIIPPPSN